MFTSLHSSEPKSSARAASSQGKTAPFFQAKLTVNTPGDAHEREADQVADQVMRMREGDAPIVQRMLLAPVSGVMRACAECEKEKMQRKETSPTPALPSMGGSMGDASGKTAPSVVSDVLSSGGGQPMEGGTRQFMESRFGQDFSQVRIHTGSQAAESASAIQARAYTSGRDVVFGAGEYQSGSEGGRRLLAHELVHVGQQSPYIHRAQLSVQTNQSTCPSASAIITAAANRVSGEIGTSYNYPDPAWWYSPNGNLDSARLHPAKWEIAQGATDPIPSSNYIINWGGTPTCNVFVYDVLYEAGYNPPLQLNKHYFNAEQTYNHVGKLKTYFEEVTDWSKVCPGDIYATGGHMEIVATTPDSEGNFEGFGGHLTGAFRDMKQAYSGNKFFRLKQLVSATTPQETPQAK